MDWTVVGKVNEAQGVVTIQFKPSKPINFKPGQYFIFYDVVNWLEDCRAYSISNSPSDENVEVTVKLVKNPHFSKHMQELPVGSSIEARGPYGDFFLEGNEKDVVLIGAGSGIAPLRSIMRALIESSSRKNITMVYSAKTKEQIIFRSELEDFALNGKIGLFVTLTQETGEFSGRIDEGLLRKAVPNPANHKFFVCGPAGMVSSTRKILRDIGVNENQIRSEEF